MRVYRLSTCIALVAIVLPCLAVAAPGTPASGVSLQNAVQGAWSRSPVVRTLEARQEEASAARASARSWIATNPTVGLSHRTDQGNTLRDQRELEVSVSSSIWMPGQKAARETLAARSTDEVSAHIVAARLAVAGEVRTRMWDAAAARGTLKEKQDHLHHMEDLAGEVQRRVTAGDLARSDGLLAQQEVLAARVEVSNARTRAAEALSRFRALTGMADLPALVPEPLRDRAGQADVRLAAARASEQRAQAALRLAGADRSGPPTVALSARREDELGLEPIRSIGIALQIPFGSKARNRPAEALAQTAVATAAAEAAETLAIVEAEIDTARERIANVEQALESAHARAAALHEHTALLDKAFRLGERGLADLLRSLALSHEADIGVAQQQVALGFAHAQLHQALGILP